MKKLFLMAAAALLIGSAANAQDVYKQQGGEQNIEVQFAPLGGSPIGIEGIRYRTFTSATTAIRAEIFLGFQSSTDVMLAGPDNDVELKMGESSFDIAIAAGMENHWAGTDRLSPYWGYLARIGFGSERMTEEGIINADEDVEQIVTMSQGSLTFGAAGVIGVDYYFADNIYIGTEIGFGVEFTTMFDKTEESFSELPNDDGELEIEETTSPGGNEFGVGPYAVGTIRVGFLF
jgi:hypothetical protein